MSRTFEYRDKKGDLLGTAEVILDSESVEMPHVAVKSGAKATGRKLLSFVLRGEKEAGTEIDLLDLANKHGVSVLAADERLVNYQYSDAKKEAVVPPLETPLDIGVFLHELGHADQFHEERFADITPLYGRAKQVTSPERASSYASMRQLLDAVVDAVPEAAVAMDNEMMAQLETLEERRKAAVATKEKRDRALEDQRRQRDDELMVLVEEGLAGKLDIEDFLRRCDEAVDRAGDVPTPLVPSAETKALVEELERAGFVFPAEGIPTGDVAVRSSLRDAKAVGGLVRALLSSTQAADTTMAFDADEGGGLNVAAAVRGVGRVLLAGLDVSENEYARYQKMRDRTDQVVRDMAARAALADKDIEEYSKAQRMLMEDIDLRSIAALPTKMMERDATRRALQWLREIRKKTGADLLAPHLVPREALSILDATAAVDGCVGSTAKGMDGKDAGVEAAVLADLKRALATYGADKFRIRRPGDEKGVGIAPIAGLDRTKEPDQE